MDMIKVVQVGRKGINRDSEQQETKMQLKPMQTLKGNLSTHVLEMDNEV